MRGGVALAVERDGVLTPVSKKASGLRFSKTAIGGHASLSASLALPTDWDLGPLDRVVVSDESTGRVLWDGYAEWPTPVDANGLRYYSLQALGGQSLMSDVIRPQYYCDYISIMDAEAWLRRPLNTPAASTEASTVPDDLAATPAVVMSFPEGKTLTPGQRVAMDYTRPHRAGRTVYRFGLRRVGGSNREAIEARVYTATDGGSSWTLNTHLSGSLSTSIVSVNGWNGAGTMEGGVNAIRLHLQHTGAGNISAAANDWNAWYDMHATAAVRRKDGSWREFADYPEPGFYPGMRADMVVEDMLARHLSGFIDAANAVVEQGTQNIDQLVDMAGMRDAEFLDSLTTWEPDFYWQVGERGTSGKHSFRWAKWPTSPRYILPSSVEFAEDGPSITLCNRILVRWKSPQGADEWLQVDVTVPALGSRVRDADPIDLPDGYGSPANAERIGRMVLEATNQAGTSGTVTVRGPIRDDVLGRQVWPWELEPGHLVWLPRGEAVRIQEVEYDDDAGTATLRIGAITPAMEQMTAGLGRVRSRVDIRKQPKGKERRRRRKKGGRK